MRHRIIEGRIPPFYPNKSPWKPYWWVTDMRDQYNTLRMKPNLYTILKDTIKLKK